MAGRITIGNQGRDKGIYVGRPTVLGNPFMIHRDGTRAEVITKYHTWLQDQWRKGPDNQQRQALLALARRIRDGEDLTLLCWCHPFDCHARIIKEAIESIIAKGVY